VLLVSHDRALLDVVAQRLLAIDELTLRSHDGGWAEYARSRSEPREPATPTRAMRKRKEKPAPAAVGKPSELERLAGEIAQREQAVADLERRLADDWSDDDTLAAHRQARDELQSLLARWEKLFEQAQA
jgi:ATPase subunit of ABC transporter with duplicated ATPase domains